MRDKEIYIQVAQEEFEREFQDYTNDLFLAYNPEVEKRLKNLILRMSETEIPSASQILDYIDTHNYDTFHGLAYTVLKFKRGGVFCNYTDELKHKNNIMSFSACEDCKVMEDCYDDIMCNDIQWEFGDETFPFHLCSLLNSVLIDGDLCVYMKPTDFYEYEDLATSFDYGNRDILDSFYKSGNKNLVIINHAQQTMFDDLFLDDDGSCYRYGDFVLMMDSFKEKNKKKEEEGYFITGGK